MASSSKITLADYNINDLDINLEKHLDHFTFKTAMGTISIDTEYFYGGVRSVNFDPLLDKVKQDGVQRIRHFYLPGEKVTRKDPDTNVPTIDRKGKLYTDLAGQITKHAIVENIYAPYASCGRDVKYLTDVLIKDARGNVKVYFPNAEYEEDIEMEGLFPEFSKNVTIFLPREWEHATKRHPRFVCVMDEKMASQAQRAKSGDTIALKLFRGDYTSRDVGATSLYSDATTSLNLFFQDLAYKYLHIQETIGLINQIKTQRGQDDDRATEPTIVIGILDSGLRVDHLAFRPEGRILETANFAPHPGPPPVPLTGEDEPMECEHDDGIDRCGHGTFCASIAAGEKFKARPPDNTPSSQRLAGEDRWLTGVAPFARIVYGTVVNWDGTMHPECVASGLRWLNGTDKQVDIISLSLGFQTFHPDLRKAISEAHMKGKIIVCAASNDGRRQQTNIAFPARFGDVICVGSHTSNGQPSALSPTGREIDFMAPGEDVWGASSAHHDAAIPMSGTSAATPFVAGIAAIVLKAAHHIGGRPLREKVSNTTVMREILRKMASMPGHHDEAMGYGNLNPYRVFRYGEDYFKNIVDEICYR